GEVRVPVWRWTLPPGSAAATTYSAPRHRLGWPYREIAGFIEVKQCGTARIAMSLTTNASDAPQTQLLDVGRGTRFSTLDWRLPDDFDSVSVIFRRLDNSPCTALVNWQNPMLTADQLSGIRRHFD
ncbi:hypothetical protein ACFQ07_06740, partial [Actinomadura adrarensis]